MLMKSSKFLAAVGPMKNFKRDRRCHRRQILFNKLDNPLPDVRHDTRLKAKKPRRGINQDKRQRFLATALGQLFRRNTQAKVIELFQEGVALDFGQEGSETAF